MKLLLLDDHPLVRSALQSVIRSLDQEVEVLAASTAAQARQLLQEQGPVKMALLDLQLPDAHGFSLMSEWRRTHPDMAVVIVSASEQPVDVVRALEEGALGFIPKRTSTEVLVHALKLVMSGGIYVPPMALRMAGHPSNPLSPDHQAASTHFSAPTRVQEPVAARIGSLSASAARGRVSFGAVPELQLTPRQSEVLELLLQGQPNKLIARELKLSVETVKDHVAALLRVLGVSSRTQAVLAVSQMMGASAIPAALLSAATPPVSRQPAL